MKHDSAMDASSHPRRTDQLLKDVVLRGTEDRLGRNVAEGYAATVARGLSHIDVFNSLHLDPAHGIVMAVPIVGENLSKVLRGFAHPKGVESEDDLEFELELYTGSREAALVESSPVEMHQLSVSLRGCISRCRTTGTVVAVDLNKAHALPVREDIPESDQAVMDCVMVVLGAHYRNVVVDAYAGHHEDVELEEAA